jgi:hypothetical protein
MEGYDIDKIKLKSAKDPSVEKLLTGKYITGLENTAEVPPNAELEGGEYLQFPDGTTQFVAGEKHEKGGVKMFIPDGTKIVSNSLYPTKKQVKRYKEEYNLKVSTKDSFASIITKFSKMIGLEKNYLEQEEVYKLIKKQQEKSDIPDATRNVNNEYLSGKVNDLDKEAQKLEQKKAEFFAVVFQDQEMAKTASKRKREEKGEMKYGGVSKKEFMDLCKQHGISYEQGLNLIGDRTPRFDNGGEFEELKEKYDTVEKIDKAYEDLLITTEQYQKLMLEVKGGGEEFTTESGRHTYSEEDVYEREKQHRSDAAFGKIGKSDIEKVMWHYYQNFPKAAKKHLGVKIGDDGKITWDKTIDFTNDNPKMRAFQKAANEVMVASDQSVLSEDGSKYFSGEFQDMARDHLENQTFVDVEGDIRSIDGKLGNFTSGRYINSVNVVTPEELEKLQGMNIYTLSQVEDALKEDPNLLSQGSQDRINRLRSVSQDNADYRLNQFEQAPAPTPEDQPAEEPISDLDITPPQPYFPRLFATPNQYPLPPSPMQAHLMGETRFQRMDPIRVGIEPQIQEAGEQRRFLADQMFGNLSPNVAASVMANQMATQTKAINEQAKAANMINANNLASTELFNIGQHAKEQEARLRNLLSFEQRQLTAQSKTEEELRRFYDQVRRIHINDFKTQQNLNMLNQMFPDYNLDPSGMLVNYEPSYEWEVKNNPFYDLFRVSPYV